MKYEVDVEDALAELERARGDFPILQTRNYLASHALGPMPRAALDDLAEYRETLLLRLAGIPAHLDAIEDVRSELARLLRTQADNVALVASATAGLGQIALRLRAQGARRRVLVSAQNFPSSRFVWQAQTRRGLDVALIEERVPSSNERSVEALAEIDERTLAVVVPWVAPYTGALLDISALSARCRAMGALCVVDAYQGVGVLPLDLSSPEEAPHVIVGGNHKWLSAASMGLAFMYVDPQLAHSLEPPAPGWIGEARFPAFASDYQPAPGARRFQQGTPAVEPIYGARAGLRFVLSHGVEQLRAASLRLTERLLAAGEAAGLKSLTPHGTDSRGATVTFDFGHLAVSAQQRLAGELVRAGVDVDFRPGGGMRVSPHPCASLDDCNAVVSMISQLLARKSAITTV